jgi:hypothetical protein
VQIRLLAAFGHVRNLLDCVPSYVSRVSHCCNILSPPPPEDGYAGPPGRLPITPAGNAAAATPFAVPQQLSTGPSVPSAHHAPHCTPPIARRASSQLQPYHMIEPSPTLWFNYSRRSAATRLHVQSAGPEQAALQRKHVQQIGEESLIGPGTYGKVPLPSVILGVCWQL